MSEEMVKCSLDWDEWYPVYSLERMSEKPFLREEVEVPLSLLTRYEAALAEWESVQNILEERTQRWGKK